MENSAKKWPLFSNLFVCSLYQSFSKIHLSTEQVHHNDNFCFENLQSWSQSRALNSTCLLTCSHLLFQNKIPEKSLISGFPVRVYMLDNKVVFFFCNDTELNSCFPHANIIIKEHLHIWLLRKRSGKLKEYGPRQDYTVNSDEIRLQNEFRKCDLSFQKGAFWKEWMLKICIRFLKNNYAHLA